MSDPRDKIMVEPEPGRVVISICGPRCDLEPYEARQLAAYIYEAASDAEAILDDEQMQG
jgi:hypothetical protein